MRVPLIKCPQSCPSHKKKFGLESRQCTFEHPRHTTTILGQSATQGRRVQEDMEKESRRQSGQLAAYECSR